MPHALAFSFRRWFLRHLPVIQGGTYHEQGI
jgi:hypothetical protein